MHCGTSCHKSIQDLFFVSLESYLISNNDSADNPLPSPREASIWPLTSHAVGVTRTLQMPVALWWLPSLGILSPEILGEDNLHGAVYICRQTFRPEQRVRYP